MEKFIAMSDYTIAASEEKELGSSSKKKAAPVFTAVRVQVFTFSPVTNLRDVVLERPVRGFRPSSFTPVEGQGTPPPAGEVLPPTILPEEAKIEAVLGADLVKPESKSVVRYFYEPLQLLRQDRVPPRKLPETTSKSPATDNKKASLTPGTRGFLEMSTVRLPKTGAIKLTGLAYELDDPLLIDDRQERPAPYKLFGFTKFHLAKDGYTPEEQTHRQLERAYPLSGGAVWFCAPRYLMQRAKSGAYYKQSDDETVERRRERVFG